MCVSLVQRFVSAVGTYVDSTAARVTVRTVLSERGRHLNECVCVCLSITALLKRINEKGNIHNIQQKREDRV